MSDRPERFVRKLIRDVYAPMSLRADEVRLDCSGNFETFLTMEEGLRYKRNFVIMDNLICVSLLSGPTQESRKKGCEKQALPSASRKGPNLLQMDAQKSNESGGKYRTFGLLPYEEARHCMTR
ncbi:unnamed protein product [Aphanomyces euteiches]